MLSVYLDGEMPSPWKEKLEDHVSGCPECAGQLEAYRGAALGHAAGEDEAARAAGARVWEKLSASVIHRAEERPARRGPIWRRRVSLPIPAAAAAGLLLVVGMALAWALYPPAEPEMGVSSCVYESGLYLPAQDMESIIEYLMSRGGSDMLVLRLPETQSFAASGEPAVVMAADYSRQLASWSGQGSRGGPGRRRQGP